MKVILGVGLITASFVANGKDFYKYDDALMDPMNVTFLNLSGDVKASSYDYSSFQCLESIVLSNCELEEVPASLLDLNEIQNVDLSYNNDLGIQDMRSLFEGLNSIQTLNLKGCDLLGLPIEIGSLNKLKKLNLSYNLLKSLPVSLKNDSLLEELNISGNSLTEIPFSIKELKYLKRLDASYNEKLNLLSSLPPGVKLDYLNLLDIDSIPNTVFKGDVGELTLNPKGFITTPKKKIGIVKELKLKGGDYSRYNFACRSIDQSKVNKAVFESDELKRIPNQIYKSSSNVLLIRSKAITSIDAGLNQMNKLERLTLNTPKVTHLYSSISKLKNLTYLDIENTNLSVNEIIRIHKAFPNLEINYNRDLGNAILLDNETQKKRTIAPPVQAYVKEGKRQVLDVQKGDVMVGEQGTIVKIYPNSFVNADGSPVTEKVEIELKEFYDPVDVFFSGIPMAYDSASSVYPFYSGGMFSLNAKTESGKEVKLNSGSTIEVTMPKKEAEGLSFYYFDEKLGRWSNEDKKVRAFEKKKKVDIVELQQQQRINRMADFNIGSFSSGIQSPVMKGQRMVVKCYQDRDGELKMNFSDDSYNGVFAKQRYFSKWKAGNVNPMDHLNKYTKYNWVLEENKTDEIVAFLKPKMYTRKKEDSLSVNKRNKKYKTSQILDIELEPNVKGDNFVIKLKGSQDSVSFMAYPDITARNARSIQRVQKRAFKKYKNAREDGDSLRSKIKKDYGKQMAKFEGDLEAWKKRREALQNDSSRFENKFVAASFLAQDLIVDNQLSRTVPITQLGTYNCDAVRKELMVQGESLKVELKDSTGRDLGEHNLSLMTTYGNGYVNFYQNDIAFFPTYKNAIIVPLATGEIAIYPSEKMNSLVGKSTASIEMILIDPIKTSKEEVRKLLNL